ncbi:hypothetical protein [Nocardioides sp. GXQ0305]|uniref:hypothetical protein n=1 Tax=Nocardioides sp. GXQ0305 TaxID=3423912 RepID=UPI003D7EBD20
MVTADDPEEPLGGVRDAARRVESAREDLRLAVEAARTAGHSWAEVGRVLGTSRQAAFKRFGTATDPRTGEQVGRRTPEGAVTVAERVWRMVDGGDYDGLRELLHDSAAGALDRETVLGTWARVVADGGRLEAVREVVVQLPDGSAAPLDEPVSGTVVVSSTLACEAADWHGRVAVDGDGRVTGLLVVPPGTTDLPF